MSRGVDVDAICVTPPVPVEAIRDAARDALATADFRALESIDGILLEPMMEWCLPSERCVAVTDAFPSAAGEWQIVYDTAFNGAFLADALSRAFPDRRIVQFNLQEETDFTLRVLQRDSALYEYSSAHSFFNWGRCVGKTESARLERIDIPALIEALSQPADAAEMKSCFDIIAAKTLGVRKSSKGKHAGGVYDAMQTTGLSGTQRVLVANLLSYYYCLLYTSPSPRD